MISSPDPIQVTPQDLDKFLHQQYIKSQIVIVLNDKNIFTHTLRSEMKEIELNYDLLYKLYMSVAIDIFLFLLVNLTELTHDRAHGIILSCVLIWLKK